MAFENVFGLVDAATGMSYQAVPRPYPAAARSTSRTICPRFNSATTMPFTFFGDCGHLFLGERPRGDQAELANLHTLLARHVDGALRHARGDPVRDHHHIGALDLFLFEERDLIDVLVILSTRRLTSLSCTAGRMSG